MFKKNPWTRKESNTNLFDDSKLIKQDQNKFAFPRLVNPKSHTKDLNQISKDIEQINLLMLPKIHAIENRFFPDKIHKYKHDFGQEDVVQNFIQKQNCCNVTIQQTEIKSKQEIVKKTVPDQNPIQTQRIVYQKTQNEERSSEKYRLQKLDNIEIQSQFSFQNVSDIDKNKQKYFNKLNKKKKKAKVNNFKSVKKNDKPKKAFNVYKVSQSKKERKNNQITENNIEKKNKQLNNNKPKKQQTKNNLFGGIKRILNKNNSLKSSYQYLLYMPKQQPIQFQQQKSIDILQNNKSFFKKELDQCMKKELKKIKNQQQDQNKQQLVEWKRMAYFNSDIMIKETNFTMEIERINQIQANNQMYLQQFMKYRSYLMEMQMKVIVFEQNRYNINRNSIQSNKVIETQQ